MGGVQVGRGGWVFSQWGRWGKTSVQTFSSLFLKTLLEGAVTTEAGSFWILIRTCFSFLPLDAAQEGTPSRYSKVRATAEGEGRHFRWGLWNIGISFRRYSSFCQCFQETVGGSWDRNLSPSPPLTEHSPPPFPPAHHPLTVIISICYPTPCFIYVVSSGPLWPTFTIINHNHKGLWPDWDSFFGLWDLTNRSWSLDQQVLCRP